MNTILAATGCALAALLAVALLLRRLRPAPNAHHRRMRSAADRALETLRPIAAQRPGAVVSYVRRMHPHAVEELVLSAAERAGHRVRRNERYVADGGVDGMIEIGRRWHLVQTKRYASAIRPEHVRDFADVCEATGKPGIFVHFGRTGPMSRQACGPRVTVLSGGRLVALIAGDPIVLGRI